MKAIIEPAVTYSLNIGGVVHKGFKKESEWHGMVRFTNPKGEVIVDVPEAGIDFLALFSLKAAEPKTQTCQIVKASTCFLPDEIKADEQNKDK